MVVLYLLCAIAAAAFGAVSLVIGHSAWTAILVTLTIATLLAAAVGLSRQ